MACVSSRINIDQQSPTFLAPGTSFVEDNFSTGNGVGGRFLDDSRAFHLLCTLFLSLLLHQLFRSSGVRSQRLGIPGYRVYKDTLMLHKLRDLKSLFLTIISWGQPVITFVEFGARIQKDTQVPFGWIFNSYKSGWKKMDLKIFCPLSWQRHLHDDAEDQVQR